jgi:hypothetical protein
MQSDYGCFALRRERKNLFTCEWYTCILLVFCLGSKPNTSSMGLRATAKLMPSPASLAILLHFSRPYLRARMTQEYQYSTVFGNKRRSHDSCYNYFLVRHRKNLQLLRGTRIGSPLSWRPRFIKTASPTVHHSSNQTKWNKETALCVVCTEGWSANMRLSIYCDTGVRLTSEDGQQCMCSSC